jgi:glycine betaine catabolism B
MKKWLDRVTGIVTMYKLILLSLVAISVIALLLSFAGQLSAEPLALLASAAVALAATFASNWIVAKLLRVTAHTDSSLITALLIFVVLRPSLEPLALASIALAGVIASVSKYLIAVRGRHVFNPAAVGVFVVSLLAFGPVPGFSYAAWWLGTPFLLLPVAIAAFAILYRTQRLTLGLVFLAVAVASIALRYVIGGDSPLDGVSYLLLSSPAVFFAGFMLSEPLTLPPRRWQQLAEATVVALLFTVPFSVGPLTSTPQLALLVGNLLAFCFGQRRAITLSYLGKKQIGPATYELSFQPARPVRFLPGQYMELTIPHRKADFRGSRRYFSISSAPSTDGPVNFAITVPEKSSSFKQALLDLKPGAVIRGTSVGGDFALPTKLDEPILLVAGGIGITPFASQLAHATSIGEKRDVVVVYQNSSTGELPYSELLQKSGAKVVLFSPTAPSPLPAGWTYAGEGRVTGERLREFVADAATRRAFISGPPALVASLKAALRADGVRRIHSDYFSGY